jgi:predicted Ser/Thr protein kinase
LPGELVGPYRIERELARGGMGAVYLARHDQLGRVAALKVLLADRSRTASSLERFQIEAEAVGRLKHPGIVGIYEAGVHHFSPYLAMEFVEGTSLQDLLREGGPFEPRRAVELTLRMAEALEHAHTQGVLHRDLKPDNVLLAGEQPRITDFGLAKQMHDTTRESLTKTGQMMGTPGYMPPEQAAGERHEFGFPSDVWGLGATLYALLTGKPPFTGQTSVQIVTKILTHEAQPPSAHREGIGPALDQICLRCLEKEPSDRYLTMTALSADLRRYLEGASVQAGLTRAQRRRRRRVLALSGILLLALGLAGVAVWANSRPSAAGGGAAHVSERAQVALADVESKLPGMEDEDEQLRLLDDWSLKFAALLGQDDERVARVHGLRVSLETRRDAKRAYVAFRDDENVNRRHLHATRWLASYDRAEAKEYLGAVIDEVRQFHAERWLRKPLAQVELIRRPPPGERSHVRVLALPQPDQVLCGTEDGALTLLGLPSGERLSAVRLRGGSSPFLAWEGDSLWAVGGQGVYRAAGFRPGELPGDGAAFVSVAPRRPLALAVSPDGQRALIAGERQDGAAGWVGFLGPDAEPQGKGLGGMVLAATTPPDGRYVTVGGASDGSNAKILVWEHGDLEFTAEFELRDRGEHVACSPDGETVAVGTSSGGVVVVRVPPAGERGRRLEQVARLPAPLLDEAMAARMFGLSPFTYGVAFSPDGRWLLASIYQRGEGDALGASGVALWDWQEGDGAQPVHVSDPVPLSANNGLALTPDGRFLVQPSSFGEVLVWDGPATMPRALQER